MFGELSISENPLATQGIVLFGSESLDANFTQSTDLSAILSGSMSVDAFFSKVSAAAGTLVAEIEITSDFTQTTQGLRFATGVADLDFQFDQTTAANFTASGDASVDANFTQTSAAIKVASGVAQVDFNFTQTSAAIAILYLLSDQTAQFDYDPLGGLLLRTGLSMDSQFDITEALGGFLRFAAQTMCLRLFLSSYRLCVLPVSSFLVCHLRQPVPRV